jgi:hypothetical protein
MNREIYPYALYPLTGDVQSVVGNAKVSVVGIQGVPILNAPFLNGGEALVYNPSTNNWQPTLRATIQVDNVTVSTDAEISVNVPKPLTVDGV